jgi:phosphosulfolactate synthase (CoM biosynthesis protein A)
LLIINKFIITKKTMNLILSYLLDEGFASDEKSATNIYNAMSDEWLDQIIEDFAFNSPEAIQKSREWMKKHGLTKKPNKEDQKVIDKIRAGITATGQRQSPARVFLGDRPRSTTTRARSTVEIK